MGNGIITVKDLSDFLERRSLCFDVEEPNEHQLAKVPKRIEQHEVPVIREIVPRKKVSLVAESEDGLDGDVENHHALGPESKRKNFEGIGNEQAREADIVENTEEPDEHDLRIAGSLVGLSRVLVDGSDNGPADERCNHAANGGKEERSATNFIDGQGGTDGNCEIHDCLASRELSTGKYCVSKNSLTARGSGVRENLHQVSYSPP